MKYTGTNYEGAALVFYNECLRVTPAMVKLRYLNRPKDLLALTMGMLEQAERTGLERSMAWSIMSTASMTWLAQVFEAQADLEEKPVEEALDGAIMYANRWAASRG